MTKPGKKRVEDPVTVVLVVAFVLGLALWMGSLWWREHRCDVSTVNGVSVTCPGPLPTPAPAR
jgi:hypothetical protein